MTKISSYINKPTQTRIHRKKYVNGSVNSEGHLKNIYINQAWRLFRPRSIHLSHKKPNPARETVLLVPLIVFKSVTFVHSCPPTRSPPVTSTARTESSSFLPSLTYRLLMASDHLPPLPATAVRSAGRASWSGNSRTYSTRFPAPWQLTGSQDSVPNFGLPSRRWT